MVHVTPKLLFLMQCTTLSLMLLAMALRPGTNLQQHVCSCLLQVPKKGCVACRVHVLAKVADLLPRSHHSSWFGHGCGVHAQLLPGQGLPSLQGKLVCWAGPDWHCSSSAQLGPQL